MLETSTPKSAYPWDSPSACCSLEAFVRSISDHAHLSPRQAYVLGEHNMFTLY